MSDANALATFDDSNMYIAESGSGKVSKLTIGPCPSFPPCLPCSNAIPDNLGGMPQQERYIRPWFNGWRKRRNLSPSIQWQPPVAPVIIPLRILQLMGARQLRDTEVVAPPIVGAPMMRFNLDWCRNNSILWWDPAGGVYTGPGMLPGNMFDPMAAGLGDAHCYVPTLMQMAVLVRWCRSNCNSFRRQQLHWRQQHQQPPRWPGEHPTGFYALRQY